VKLHDTDVSEAAPPRQGYLDKSGQPDLESVDMTDIDGHSGTRGWRSAAVGAICALLAALSLVAGRAVAAARPGPSANGGGSCAPRRLSPTAITPLPGGGQQYLFGPGGSIGTVVVAPAGFRPAAASAAKLAEYGFPPRPSGGSALAGWRYAMSRYRRTAPELTLGCAEAATSMSRAATASVRPAASQRAKSSQNWAGYDAYGSNHHYFAAVHGYFIQSKLGPHACDPAGQEGSWIGLGGGYYGSSASLSSSLLQGGTAINGPSGAHGKPPGTYAMFYEYVVFSTHENKPVYGRTVRPGDKIFVYVGFQTSNHKADIYVEDTTSGHTEGLERKLPAYYYDGITADWVNERPGATLADFEPTAFSDAQAQVSSTGRWEDLGSENRYQLTMVQTIGQHGQLLASPGRLKSKKDFRIAWNSCELSGE
jgi:hypothetical protein